MREFFIDTEHGKIWCSAYGEKQANTPLLVVHGGPGFLSMPQTVSDFSTDRPVYFYDQSGCGRSDKAEDSETYSLDNYVEELSLVRNKLGLSEVVLLGFSWGCGLICSYMLKKKPAGVRGIILSGPLLSSPMWEKDQKDNISELPESFSRAIMEGERTQNYIGP
ncbi:MAG: alpha/beta fold hydrolase, partial [Vulcanimicrobiota bacterium]